jgi:glycine/D-amino acid oxidase-like deaminating enzyme
VVKINIDGGYITSILLDDNTELKGDSFVFCTGPETPRLFYDLFKIVVPIANIKGYSFHIKP